jgi:type II secretory pathway pseudopilin PulG
VFVVGALFAVGLPVLRKTRLGSRAAATASDLRAFSTALQSYVRDKGDWPDGPTEPGAFPAGTESYLRSANWTHSTPIGGRYMWATTTPQQGERYRAVIVIASVPGDPAADDREQLLAIDRLLDDGNLARGKFRLGFRNQPIFVLEP